MEPGAIRALNVWTTGPEHREALVFLHGYPDDSSLWEQQMEYFQYPQYARAIDTPR